MQTVPLALRLEDDSRDLPLALSLAERKPVPVLSDKQEGRILADVYLSMVARTNETLRSFPQLGPEIIGTKQGLPVHFAGQRVDRLVKGIQQHHAPAAEKTGEEPAKCTPPGDARLVTLAEVLHQLFARL